MGHLQYLNDEKDAWILFLNISKSEVITLNWLKYVDK